MAVWANLPPELTTQVLHELEPSRTKTPDELRLAKRLNRVDQDLLSCTYVSHQFRAIVEPLLYRKVHIPVLWNTKQGKDPFRSLRQFTRALVLRPELVNHVREIDTESLDAEYDDEGNNIGAFIMNCNVVYEKEQVDEYLSATSEAARGDLEHILPAVGNMGLDNGLLIHGGTNGLLIILFHLLSKLQKLEITARSELEFIARSCFGVFHGGVPTGLKSVSEVLLSYEDTEYGFGTTAVVPFMALPGLNTLIIAAFAAEDGHDGSPWLHVGGTSEPIHSTPESPPESRVASTFYKTSTGYALPLKSSSIKDLSLWNSVVSSLIINRMLLVSSGLERFEYGVGGSTVGYERYRPAGFLPGLLSQASSLKELVIDRETADRMDDQDEPLIGSLAGLVALETLRVPASLLLPTFNDEEATGRENDNDGPAILRNPMDNLLPPKLTSLQYDLKLVALKNFCKQTGLPRTLRFTRERIPSLINFTVGRRPILQDDDSVRELVQQTPVFEPPMNVHFFGIKNIPN
ncbi:hypothetical protein DL93DRAFT_2232167 [Clavulina sp. PMI_390]|nr:hypothetical protein DL93DRAFT_2232167 [Clavulina sp. PMI_390]